jgi:hypothetical protein
VRSGGRDFVINSLQDARPNSSRRRQGGDLQLKKAGYQDIAALRQEKIEHFHAPLFPNFHLHLARHADAFEIKDGPSTVGYTLLLFDRHEEHEHVTLIELYLTPPYRDRYEDALDLIAEEYEPRAYLARSDDCPYETALISLGYPMEMSMSVMVARATPEPDPITGLSLVPLDYPHLRAAHNILAHTRGVDEAPTMGELERAMDDDNVWVLTEDGRPIGLIVQEESEGQRYGILDVLAPHVSDPQQVWAVQKAGRAFADEGLQPAAVIDARDVRKLQVFRKAGYYTAATYLIFYDPEAGRVQVPVMGREELWTKVQGKEDIRLVDVLGEDHWRRGHLPGAEWIDYRKLTREARKRFEDKGQTIVAYCNDYT